MQMRNGSIVPREHCQCGDALGEDMCAELLGEIVVIVEWMPEQFRESHRAANNKGRWPLNGALRLRMTPDCASHVLRSEYEFEHKGPVSDMPVYPRSTWAWRIGMELRP